MTELAIHQPQSDLTIQMDYARAVSSASMLPENYRNKPADIMLAVGLGQSMGLSPAESLYRISVIKGKPTASAELIAANVRKAGHRLRVRGDEQTCTATIVRADDPDYEFTVTRDVNWAKGMGLADQTNYRKQPGTMLQWRAITAVARLACPEALYGVQYTPDEVPWDDRNAAPSANSGSAADRMGAVLGQTTVEVIKDEPADVSDAPLMLDTRSKLAKRMYATITEAGITDAERLPWISSVIGRDIESSKEMTEVEASECIDRLTDAVDNPFPTEPGAEG